MNNDLSKTWLQNQGNIRGEKRMFFDTGEISRDAELGRYVYFETWFMDGCEHGNGRGLYHWMLSLLRENGEERLPYGVKELRRISRSINRLPRDELSKIEVVLGLTEAQGDSGKLEEAELADDEIKVELFFNEIDWGLVITLLDDLERSVALLSSLAILPRELHEEGQSQNAA